MPLRVPILACLLLGCCAFAAEAPKDKPKPELDRPTDADLDKPGESDAPVPPAIPDEPKTKDQEKGKPEAPKAYNPFRGRPRWPKYAAPSRVTYSDGTVLEGYSWRRANGTIRIYNRKSKAHEDYYVEDLKKITVKVESTTFERDWRWKNQGSSEKVFLKTGYIWSQNATTFSIVDGDVVTGDCAGIFRMVTLDGKRTTWILHKRHSGRDTPHKERKDLEPLVYVQKVEFTDDILKKKPEEEGGDAGKTPPETPAKKTPASK